MATMKTPGVCIVEKSVIPNSVVEVATAVPAFIGYTEKADNGGKTLRNKPWRITNMSDFHNYYGASPSSQFEITEKAENSTEEAAFMLADKEYLVKQTSNKYTLYNNMLLFFQNGGGPCYIVSVGTYTEAVEPAKLKAGIEPLIKEQEPTLIVIPEAVLLKEDDCISVQQAVIAHCGEMSNRFAIIDVWGGYKNRQHPSGDCISNFRSKLGDEHLRFSAAYYPWLNATVVKDSELSYSNIANIECFESLMHQEIERGFRDLDGLSEEELSTGGYKLRSEKRQQMYDKVASIQVEQGFAQKTLLHRTLCSMSVVYTKILEDIKSQLNLLPPSALMAGIYTMVDNERGVWKAPANVSLHSVRSPAVNISHYEQEDLNVTTQGKSINAIRAFMGEATLVWGARTLDGNSLDWRYVSVRRTMIMLEESIRLAVDAFDFEANTEKEWVTIKSMITNFLTGIWQRGGLVGSSPEDAFSVSVGLGQTMTDVDILEGILRIKVLVAVARPAEFIEMIFQQQMQKS